VFSVPHIVRTGETLPASAYHVSAGGKGANQSAAAGRAGANILHAGKIGKDGGWVKQMMHSDYNVDCRYLWEDGSLNTGRAIIQVSQQTRDNAIVLFAGANHSITAEDVSHTFNDAQFQRGEWLMLQNEINVNAMQTAIQLASEHQMIVMLNPAPMTSDFCRHCPLNMVNILVLNEVEAADLYRQLLPQTPASSMDTTVLTGGEEFVEAMQVVLDALCNHFPDPMCGIIITLGSCGLITKFRTGPNDEWSAFRVPAYPTTVVDTTGAGDTFIGFFAAQMLRETADRRLATPNHSADNNGGTASIFLSAPRFDAAAVERSLRFASKASSIACSRAGAMISIPRRDEVGDY
jgi:ribokinase